MNFQPHTPIQTTDGTVYDTDYFLEPYMFGMRCLIHAQRSGDVALGFTVYFPPSFFGARRVQHSAMVKRAFDEVKLAIESRMDAVKLSQSQPTGYEINCAQP